MLSFRPSSLPKSTSLKGNKSSKVVCFAKAEAKAEDGRSVRRSLNQTGRYIRHLKEDASSQKTMEKDGVGYSANGLLSQIKKNNNLWQEGNVQVKIAKAYGYCWGVERAVRMAYEARASFPDKNIYIINEIIHNPEVNKKLRALGVIIINGKHGEKDYSVIQVGDVVIFPAFGATVEEMKFFRDKGVHIVDTTCPWVAKVWNSVDIHGRKKYTSVIHGKYSHEETIATASFAANYIIIKDLEECQIVSDYITKPGSDKTAFLKRFKKATSKGFDPDVHLQHIGLANQTTMLKGDTMQIGKNLEAAMLARYGPEKLNKHFLLMETICDATQERQDALFELVKDPSVDMMLVVGGFNSSNTSHLQEISEDKGLKSFWVDGPSRVDVDSNTIHHKLGYGELKETKNWIQKGKAITVGVTSGASTPDRTVEEVLEKLFSLAN
mmetsp:Transcript_13311/g.23570  ORF Transcript_13311/g.23570 Transcript_13311/m.23570 type:complete len:438 (-) Transcript_13311:1011-2324(-)